MRNRKYRSRRVSLFIVFLLLILIFLFLYDGSDENMTDNNKELINFNEYITDSYESDQDAINTIFSNGISLEDYKKILTRKSEYISSSGEYKYINYNFSKNLHYSEIEKYLYNMNNLDIVNLELIGKTVDNRNIYGLVIGSGDKTIFIDANIHAAEVGNTHMLMQFLSEILNKYYDNDENMVSILNNVKLAIMPCINPDGYEIYNFGIESLNNKDLWIYKIKNDFDFNNIKCNANGIDINRSFPTQNAGLYYKSENLLDSVALDKTTKTGVFFGGYTLGSEPETRAAMYFILKHYKNVYAYVNMHSQGRVIYAGKPNLSNGFNKITREFANKISSYTNYSVFGLSAEEVGEGNDGSITDFMAELANGFKYSTITNKLSIDKYIDNSSKLYYNIPVITLETLNTYTKSVSLFKDEYYNYGIRDMLYALIKKDF